MISALRFLFTSDPFVESIAKAKRMRILVIRMEQDVGSKKHKDFVEKANALKRVIGVPHASNSHCFLKLLHKKQQKVAEFPECDGKNHLKHTMDEELHLIKMLIHAIGTAGLIKEPREMNHHMQKMHDIVEKLRARTNHDLKIYHYVLQTVKKPK